MPATVSTRPSPAALARRAVPRGALAAAALLLAACAGTGEQETRFYVIEPLARDTAPLDGAPAPPVSLEVASVRLPRYLERPQIVTRAAGNEIALAEYRQWGGNLGKDLLRVLARNLSRLLATPEVAIFSRRAARAADFRIEADVLEFERGPDARVRLAVQWRVRRGAGAAPDVVRITELASEPVPAGAGMDATVAAMSALWSALSVEVAVAVAEAAR